MYRIHTLLTLQTLPSVALLEQTVLLTFNGLKCWLRLLALQTSHLVVLLEQIRWLRLNDLTSLLVLLTLQTLRLAALLEQTGLLTINGLTSSRTLLTWITWTLTCSTLLATFCWCKCDPLTLAKIDWPTLDNCGKSRSFNEKEIVVSMFCVVISLYDLLLLVEEILIWLHGGVIANVIDLASLTLPCLMRCSKSLYN